ncbi:hypothetical protein [Pseudarthrobacter sp. NamE5]|uniref:hypothetical protein n=1 Tax=Pseudarthrobacter sp. NamE5 TaxID=2576839 RepID=UPI001486CC01|nr:hypothetical protein [Pseudarthrobacter sp. NamE5]
MTEHYSVKRGEQQYLRASHGGRASPCGALAVKSGVASEGFPNLIREARHEPEKYPL